MPPYQLYILTFWYFYDFRDLWHVLSDTLHSAFSYWFYNNCVPIYLSFNDVILWKMIC